MNVSKGKPRSTESGSATVAALVSVVALVGVTGAFLAMSAQGAKQRNESGARHRAFLAAQSGIAHTLANMNTEGVDDPHEASVGVTIDDARLAVARAGYDAALILKVDSVSDYDSESEPDTAVQFGNATYWTNVFINDDDTYTVSSTGSAAGSSVTLQVVVGELGGGVYANAIFAGNEDEDPLYTMPLSGTGGQADTIVGSIYSGGNVALSGDATVSEDIRAQGWISGTTDGETGSTQPIPDLTSMNYETTADIDVASLFSGASYKYDNAGGYAYQMPEDSPAHIFRKNPSDRKSEYNSTSKDDYFLEDPYESVSADSSQDGSSPYKLSLSGVSGEPGSNGNGKVYYIDGNLWLHNKHSYSIGLDHKEANGVQITFVVKGNIYFSDNFFYEDDDKDGVAFIAMEDPDVEDSGNVYLGDPEFGTLKRMNAFMYAQNNFYDYNLDASGSARVEIYGNMTAGNQVLIERDFGTSHTKLSVEFDERLVGDSLDLPMLPSQSGAEGSGFAVQGWWHGH